MWVCTGDEPKSSVNSDNLVGTSIFAVEAVDWLAVKVATLVPFF